LTSFSRERANLSREQMRQAAQAAAEFAQP
jgi:hypothetical protein